MLPAIAPKSFTNLYRGYYKDTGKKYKDNIIFYPGCAIEYFYPYMGVYLLKVLDKIDVKVNIPKKNGMLWTSISSFRTWDCWQKYDF